MDDQTIDTSAPPDIPRLERLRVSNYRALHDVRMDAIRPLTVLIGPNGSGKSTLFDVFAFMAECFGEGLRRAWDKRGRFKQLRTRGSSGPIIIELRYREVRRSTPITYHLELTESSRGPVVEREWMQWTRGSSGRPFRFLDYKRGEGKVISDAEPLKDDRRIEVALAGSDVLAVSTLGQLKENPRVQALREFITGWHLSYLSASAARGNPEAGAQERLSQTGDNLANVIQYLREQHPARLASIFEVLRQRVPRLERFDADVLADGRLLLTLKDAPFDEPILARFASDGTLKLLAYLVQLYDPSPPPLIGIEEPENFLHPRLLPQLAEECSKASERTQLIVTTHSPFLIDRLRAEEVRVMYRDSLGFSQVRRVADMAGIKDFLDEGASLGDLWMENRLEVGDPLRP